MGVGLVSLLGDARGSASLSVGIRVYATVYYWRQLRMQVHSAGFEWPHGTPLEELKWEGRPVIDWFKRELAFEHSSETRLGWLKCDVPFASPRALQLGAGSLVVEGLTFEALHLRDYLSTWVAVRGDGLYDFTDERIIMASDGRLVTDPIGMDLSRWDKMDCEPPPPSAFFTLHLELHSQQFPADLDAPDVASW